MNHQSLTHEHLLLHRVDASQLQAPLRIVHGPIEQRRCRPGMCDGLATCTDFCCEGHPANDVQPHERDASTTRRFWLAYAAGVVVFLAAVIPNADRIVGLFIR